MADYKFPDDGTEDGGAPLNLDQSIDFPQRRTEAGNLLTFEVNIIGVTALDAGVQFLFFSSLSSPALDAGNVKESFIGVALNGLLGDLAFLRDIVNTAHSSYRVKVTGTNGASTATFSIHLRSVS